MSIVLLNIVLGSIFFGIAGLLTLIAIILIVVSLVRSSKAKKQNKKTKKVGLWIGVAMLVIPWVIVAIFIAAANVMDSANNRWLPGREVLAKAVANKDAEELYEMMADDVIDKNDITVEDMEEFLEQCDLENVSSKDIELYSDFGSDKNHYRNYTSYANGRAQTCFQYMMYEVNDDGAKIYIAAVDGDPEGEEYVGIYYIEYQAGDDFISIGEKPPKEG